VTITFAAAGVPTCAPAIMPSYRVHRYSGAMPFSVALQGTGVSRVWAAVGDQLQTQLPCPNVMRKHNAAGVQGAAPRGRPV
jgi:hypothetical protein